MELKSGPIDLFVCFFPGPHVIPLPGSSSKSRTLENFSASNVNLSEAELKEINEAIDAFEVVGDRYPEGVPVWT